MSARRFFIEGVRATGDAVTIAGGDAHKIAHVLRLHQGDRIEVVDSGGALFAASIEAIGDGTVSAALLERSDAAEDSHLHVDVAQAVPKGQKMDFVVEKATELGAHAILPFYSERTVVHDVGDAKTSRWQRLATAAAQQCGRRAIPQIARVRPFDDLLDEMKAYDCVLFPWELAPHEPLLGALTRCLEDKQRVLIVVGPEGGFSHREADAAAERGACLLWLGPRILRTETAAMALLAIVQALVP